MIPEHPHIDTDFVVSTRDGYQVRVLCLADGYPAEVEIVVNTHNRDYSRAELNVFDPVSLRWAAVYSMQTESLRDLPTLGDSPDAIRELNGLANHLRNMGDLIFATANRAQDHAEANAEVIKQTAIAQHFRESMEAERLRNEAPTIANGEFVDPVTVSTGDGQVIPVLVTPTLDEDALVELRDKLAGDA